MCPFLDDEESDNNEFVEEERSRINFFKNDRKFFIIGGASAVVAFAVVCYVLCFNSKPVDLEDLPVIHAENTPFKIKPQVNEQVKHQDKTVYDNISGDSRKIEEKIAKPVEEVVSLPETDVEDVLSEEEKNDIIQAFDELAPKTEPERKVKPVKEKKTAPVRAEELTIVEEKPRPKPKLQPPLKSIKPENKTPIKPIKQEKKASIVKKKKRLKDVLKDVVAEEMQSLSSYEKPSVMVQIASVPTKAAAEAEYNRILYRNKYLKKVGKRIYKVNLGTNKGVRYRVQVGPFSNREKAKHIVEKLRDGGCSAYISK